MVILKVYSKCNKTNFKSTAFSKATLFIFVTKVAVILLPVIFAYKSKGFWLKRETFYEQPNIKFKYEYIFAAETNDINAPIFCSNVINFQETNKFNKCSLIKVREIDHNDDGKYDELSFSLTVSSSDIIIIQSTTLIMMMDYEIHTVCPFYMNTAAIIQQYNNKASSQLNVIGDLNIMQSTPLLCHPQKTHYEHKYMQSTTANHFKTWDFIKDHFKRNVSTKVDNLFSAWTAGSGSTFDLDILLKYPEHSIYYRPNFWQIMKYAWIQYLSLFILISWIVNKIKDYVFTNRLVLYRIDRNRL